MTNPKLRWISLGLTLALGLIACAVNGRVGSLLRAPPQGWDQRRGPVVPHDSFPKDCSLCHVGESWRAIREDFRFDHGREAGLALVGAHAQAECLRCHNDRGPVQLFAQRGCAGCHEDVHRRKQGQECASCHTETNWVVKDSIALHAPTRFPLVGAHAATACYACHPGAQVGNFDRTTTQCIGCHQADLAQAVSPDHAAQGWTNDCQRCHIPTTWAGSGFNHQGFPLTGMHAQIACNACHVGDVFEGTPTSCAACHLDDYQGTTSPNHAQAGFPTNCQVCHSTAGWTPASFSHPQFPITSGDHAGIACAQCHTTPGNFGAFSCTVCHPAGEMNDEHRDVDDYVFQSQACYQCHPNGEEDLLHEGWPQRRVTRRPGARPVRVPRALSPAGVPQR